MKFIVFSLIYIKTILIRRIGISFPTIPGIGQKILLAAAAVLVLFTSAAGAKTELNEPGAIAIAAKDELGNPAQGFTARIVLPAGDGELYNDVDITVTKTDGVSDDDLKKMKKASGDGDVELAAGVAAMGVRGGEKFEVTVLTPGLVDASEIVAYATDRVNFASMSQKYVVKIEAVDGEGGPLPGFEASAAGGEFVADGSEQDMDVTKNGIIYLNEDILKGKEEKEIEVVAKLGEIEERGKFTISGKAQKPVRFVFEKQ